MLSLPVARWSLVFALLMSVRLFAADTPPKPLLTVAPDYPTELLNEPMEGRVLVEMVISAEGRVENPVIKSSDHDAFSRETLKALAAWEFEPGTKDGEPVARRVNLPFDFKPNPTDLLNRMLGRQVYVRFADPPIPMRELGQRPRPTVRPRPMYPQSKEGSGEEVRVRMRFVIGQDGATYNPELLDDVEKVWAIPAIATVAAMKFEPMKKDGELVSVLVTFPVLISENPPRRPRPAGAGRGGGGGGGRVSPDGL